MSIAPGLPKAGRIKYFVSNWEDITQDPWVLGVVQGYSLEFESQPILGTILPQFQLSQSEALAMDREVSELERKGAIEPAKGLVGYVSSVFLVPKKDGGMRLIINLKSLNAHLRYVHFKMEDIRSIKDILQPGDYMGKLDLKDAYLAVPMKDQHRKYLQFQWRDKLLQFTTLPFGLASAPRVFTKLLRPALAHLRQQGIRCLMYIDDMLVLGASKEELKRHYKTCQTLLTSLGFIINVEKSVPGPTQSIEFLGFVIDSTKMSLSVTPAKIRKVKSECRKLLEQPTTTVRQVSRLIGLMTSMTLAIKPAPLHYRALQLARNDALHHLHSYESQVTMSREAQNDLQWWCSRVTQSNGCLIHPPEPQLRIDSDASNSGWGAVCNGETTGGSWSLEETQLHINSKELLAAFLALKAFSPTQGGIHIRLRMDNQAAVTYVNRMGGTHSQPLCSIAKRLWEWCMDHQLTVSAEHLPGIMNVTADAESRFKPDASEWALDAQVFQRLMKIRDPCEIDLFASRLSAKLQIYYSWKPDPGALATDALAQDWRQLRGYAFPPFCLIGRCLAKIQREEVPEILLIAPIWPSQPWYPLLIRMITEIPVILPTFNSLLLNPLQEPHPLVLQGHLQLAAWSVSGLLSRQQDFQMRLSKYSVHHGDQIQSLHTLVHGENGVLGAMEGRPIPCLRM